MRFLQDLENFEDRKIWKREKLKLKPVLEYEKSMKKRVPGLGDMDDQFSTSERPDLAGGDSYARGPLSKGDYAVDYARRRRSGQKKSRRA